MVIFRSQKGSASKNVWETLRYLLTTQPTCMCVTKAKRRKVPAGLLDVVTVTIFSTSMKRGRSNSATIFCDSHRIASQEYRSHVGTFSLLLPFKRRRFLLLVCCGLSLHLQSLTTLASTRLAKVKRRNRSHSFRCISMRTAILAGRGTDI